MSDLRELCLESCLRRAIEGASETQLPVFADRGNKLLPFPIDDEGAPTGGAGGGALRGIDCDLARNVSAVDERRSQFGEARIVNRDRGNNAVFLGLLNDFKI